MRDPCENRNALYQNYINFYILVVILYHSFARCYHWDKLVNNTQNFHVLFLRTVCKFIINSKEEIKFKNQSVEQYIK